MISGEVKEVVLFRLESLLFDLGGLEELEFGLLSSSDMSGGHDSRSAVRTDSVLPQPRLYAFKVEDVDWVAGQLDDVTIACTVFVANLLQADRASHFLPLELASVNGSTQFRDGSFRVTRLIDWSNWVHMI